MPGEKPRAARPLIGPFIVSAALGLSMIPLAFGLADALGVNLGVLLAFRPYDLIAGLAATLPMVAMLKWLLVADWRPLAEFRAKQLEFFSSVGFRFTLGRSLALALIAGVAEELLFRGVLQTAAERALPVAAAILLTNTLFGALHARSALYAIIATMIGCWLGLLYHWTGSITAPMIAHALYDLVALMWTQKAIDKKQVAL